MAAVAAVLLFGGARAALALDPIDTVVTNVDPHGVAVNPATGRLFVVGTDTMNGQRLIRVIDGSTYQQTTVSVPFFWPASPMPYGASRVR